MSRSGLPRATAPITSLFGLVLIFGPGRPYVQRHRVELHVPPVEAALWLANGYPEYFTSGEAGLQPWLDSLDPRERALVLAMAQTLTWAWVEHELAQFEERDVSGLIREATTVVRHETLNQLEVDVEELEAADAISLYGDMRTQVFGQGVFARLIRGVSNCEGQNHLLALLLDEALQLPEPWPNWIRTVDSGMFSVPKHALVRLNGPALEQPVFVDAWSNLPAFSVEPDRPHLVPLLWELGESPPPVVLGYVGREPASTSTYASGVDVEVVMEPQRDAPAKPADLQVRAPDVDEASLAKIDDPWRLYLFARILDVYDDPRAAGLYTFVLEHHCRGRSRPALVCTASVILLERVGA